MAFSRNHFAFGLANLALESRLLALNPPKPLHDSQAHGVIVDSHRRCYPNTAIRGINAQVKILDRLAKNLNRNAAYDYLLVSIVMLGFDDLQNVLGSIR
jgi:hypothetical protein